MPTTAAWNPPIHPFTVDDVEVTRKVLATAARGGRVVRLARGVYLAPEAWPDDPAAQHLLHARAQQVRRPSLVLARESAALAHHLPLHDERVVANQPPHLTRAHLDDLDVVEFRAGLLAGLRLTAPARTALDLAAAAPLPVALVALDAVARTALVLAHPRVEPREADEALADQAGAPLRAALARRGGRRLAEVVALVDPRRESPPESYSAGIIHLSPLPEPRSQPAVVTRDGVRWPDFGWEHWRLAGEVDGAVKYRGERGDHVRIAEKLREEALADAGWEVVRWMPAEIYRRPAAVMDRIARALSRRGWSG